MQFVKCDNHITVLAQVIEFVRGFVIYRFRVILEKRQEIVMPETYVTECEYCPTEVVIPVRTGPWQGWLPRDTFLCDDCFDMIHEED